MNEIILTRKELYQQIWLEPLKQIAKKYQVSDYTLRVICKKYEIPLPKSGYWMKLQFGKPVEKEKLNENYKGDEKISLEGYPKTESIDGKALSPIAALKLEIEKDRNVSLVVPEKLTNPDRLIVSTKNALKEEYNYDRKESFISAWKELRISVTKKLIDRALKFMDTLIKAIRARGNDVEVSNGETCVLIYGEKIKISCREKSKRIIIPGKYYNSSELKPTGVLAFSIDGIYSKEWTDGKLKLEDQLSSILAKIEIEGKRSKEQSDYWKRWREEQKIKKEKLEEKYNLKEKELEKFKALIIAAKRYDEVLKLKKYINTVEDQAKEKGIFTDELKEWIVWAQKKTDWYDPFINLFDPILENVDRDSLDLKEKKPSSLNWE
jgi:hypothetical protein